MIVCSCNVLSAAQIRAACHSDGSSPRTAGEVYRCLGCSPQCGRCARTIRGILADACAASCAICPARAVADALTLAALEAEAEIQGAPDTAGRSEHDRPFPLALSPLSD